MIFRQKVKSAGDMPVLGAFLGLAVPPLVEVIGRVGFDFIILDGEHGVFCPESLEECLRAAGAVNLPAIVRIPDSNPCYIQAALDAGAQGVQVPAVETPEQVRTIVDASHFPPQGQRGLGSTNRAAGYGFIPRPQVLKMASEEIMVIIQVETRKGVENLSALLVVDGVDLVFLGVSDMSLDYGYESPSDPAMLPLLESTIQTIRQAGKMCGVHISDWAFLPRLRKLGVSYFTIASLAVMGQSLQRLVKDFNEKVG